MWATRQRLSHRQRCTAGLRFDDAQVSVRVLCDCPSAVVRGDAARLRAVLVNLLTNALKYSPAGGTVTVEISSGQNAGAAALQVAVTDEGPDMTGLSIITR